MDIRFETTSTVNGQPCGRDDKAVWVKKTTEVLSHWAPSPDAFGPAEWEQIGWITKVGTGRFCFLKVGHPAWGPARPTREQAVLAVLF